MSCQKKLAFAFNRYNNINKNVKKFVTLMKTISPYKKQATQKQQQILFDLASNVNMENLLSQNLSVLNPFQINDKLKNTKYSNNRLKLLHWTLHP